MWYVVNSDFDPHLMAESSNYIADHFQEPMHIFAVDLNEVGS